MLDDRPLCMDTPAPDARTTSDSAAVERGTHERGRGDDRALTVPGDNDRAIADALANAKATWGGRFLVTMVPRHAGGSSEPRDVELLARLTAREREVLILTAQGYSMKEIAKQLHRSERTISKHRDHISGKTGLGDRVAITRFAIRVGVVTP